jgi:hypothetical protein
MHLGTGSNVLSLSGASGWGGAQRQRVRCAGGGWGAYISLSLSLRAAARQRPDIGQADVSAEVRLPIEDGVSAAAVLLLTRYHVAVFFRVLRLPLRTACEDVSDDTSEAPSA